MYGIIYKTTNLINGKFYVGQSIRVDNKNYYGSGKHLRNAIKKYGKENFEKEILEECNFQKKLDKQEIYWIAKLNPEYNIDLGGNGTGKYTEERKQQMNKYRIGKTYEELYGKEKAKEIRDKQSELKKGIKKSEKHCQNMRKPKSDEHRKNISKGRTGIKFSEKHCKNISESIKGENNPNWNKPRSENTKRKIGNSNRGENNGMFGKTKEKNPMYGKSIYDIWVEKYGKEKANKKWKERYKKK